MYYYYYYYVYVLEYTLLKRTLTLYMYKVLHIIIVGIEWQTIYTHTRSDMSNWPIRLVINQCKLSTTGLLN